VPRRALSIHEHVSFGLLKQYDVAVPRGEVAYSPLDAEAIAQDLGGSLRVLRRAVCMDR
jgi:succinyl-CoA synthetase beta subunit